MQRQRRGSSSAMDTVDSRRTHCGGFMFPSFLFKFARRPPNVFSTPAPAVTSYIVFYPCINNVTGDLVFHRRDSFPACVDACLYNTIQYNTIQYNTIQYNTIQYNTIQYNTMQCNAMQCNAMQCNAMQCNAMQCNTIQYNTIHTIQQVLFPNDHREGT